MKRFESKINVKEEKLEESPIGTMLYKELGKLIRTAEKEDLSLLTPREKTDIKDRCKELSRMIK